MHNYARMYGFTGRIGTAVTDQMRTVTRTVLKVGGSHYVTGPVPSVTVRNPVMRLGRFQALLLASLILGVLERSTDRPFQID